MARRADRIELRGLEVRKYLTPEDRLVQRRLLRDRRGDPFAAVCRELQITRSEVHVDMLADQVRHMLTPLRGAAILTSTGAQPFTMLVMPGATVTYFNAAGSSVVTITKPSPVTVTAVAAGGGGGPNNGSSESGGDGGGAGAYTLGTSATLLPGRTYTVTIPGATTGVGGSLTLVGSVEGTILSLPGGNNGNVSAITYPSGGATGGSAGSAIGANLHTGASGGQGGVESIGFSTSQGGGNDGNSAGGGGGAQSGDGFSSAQIGGAGRDQAGGPTTLYNVGTGSRNGGRGGGWNFGGAFCGAGGGGQPGDINAGTWDTEAGYAGGSKWAF